MKPILLAAALLATPTVAFAQSAEPAQVGIEEKLNALVALDAPLKDEQGQTVTLRSLIRKPTVLTLNYFRCAGICTPQLNGVVDVANAAKATPGVEYQIITVSFDPRDTPEIAVTKRENYLKEIKRPVAPEGWRFLTGDAAASRAIADSVGFKYKQQGDEFIHAAALMILSPGGKVTRYMFGTTYLPVDLEMAIQEAAKGEARPTISKWLSICYSQDPSGRGTVFSFTKASALLLILGAIVFGIFAARGGRKPDRDAQP